MAGCAGQAGTVATAPVTASFAAGSPAWSSGEIEVQVTDREAATQVELVAPGGRVYPAYQILRDRTIEGGAGAGAGIGIGGGWGSGSGVSTGVGFGFPLGGGGSYREPTVRSTARIKVADMVAYRANWQAWKVRVRLGGAGRTIEIAAPAPPDA